MTRLPMTQDPITLGLAALTAILIAVIMAVLVTTAQVSGGAEVVAITIMLVNTFLAGIAAERFYQIVTADERHG